MGSTLVEIYELNELMRVQRLMPAAMICALLANIHRDEKKRATPFAPADFLGPAGEGQRASGMTQEQWIAVAKQWGAALGGAI